MKLFENFTNILEIGVSCDKSLLRTCQGWKTQIEGQNRGFISFWRTSLENLKSAKITLRQHQAEEKKFETLGQ